MTESTEGKTSTPSAMTPERIAEIRERVEKASRHIGDICAGRVRWKMTVPVDEERDSDLILSNSLQDVFTLLAEVERVSRDLAEARAEVETMTAVAESNQRAHAIAVQEIQRLNAKLVAGHDGCEAEQQKLAMRDEWRDFERMRPVVEAAQAWREATKPHMPTNAGYEAEARLIIVVDAYDDYAGDIPGRCTRCGGLDGTHTIRNCAAALSPVDVPAQPEADR